MTDRAYRPTLGMEVHVELATRTKLFCRCPHASQELPPNRAVCPVCLGLPGALPSANRAALALGLRAALALNCRINETVWFERKNYLYPDLVKGYQISQYAQPLGEHGWLAVDDGAGGERRVAIRRVHLEEDTAKLVHADGRSWVDANRSGAPLLEIVTEPELHSGAEAEAYARALRALLVYHGVSRCRIQRGEMRAEANVSVAPVDAAELGNRVEIKNQAGFRHLRDAVEYEIERQTNALQAGGRVRQETRGWDVQANATFVQRAKEDAHDYRYFPDPDLLPLRVDAAWIASERDALGEPPRAYTGRLRDAGVPAPDVEALTRLDALGFLRAAAGDAPPDETARLAKRVVKDVFALANSTGITLEESRLEPDAFRRAVRLADAGDVAPDGFRQLVERLYRDGGEPEDIVEREGLRVARDDRAVEAAVREALAEAPGLVADFHAGKAAVRNALLGRAMKKIGRRALPRDVAKRLDECLAEGAP